MFILCLEVCFSYQQKVTTNTLTHKETGCLLVTMHKQFCGHEANHTDTTLVQLAYVGLAQLTSKMITNFQIMWTADGQGQNVHKINIKICIKLLPLPAKTTTTSIISSSVK